VSGFLIDTNVPSELTKSRPDPRVESWIAAQSNPLFVSGRKGGEKR